jgi:3-keto-5-aminohexanoate cleavage enzyme
MNALIRHKCDIVLNNSTGGGINGDMIRELPNGLWEIAFEEGIKGIEAGAEMCTLDAQTICASFGGKEILVPTTPKHSRLLAESMLARAIKPEWEVFSLDNILQDVATLIAAGLDKPPTLSTWSWDATVRFRAPCRTARRSCSSWWTTCRKTRSSMSPQSAPPNYPQ